MLPLILAVVGGYFIGDSIKNKSVFAEGGKIDANTFDELKKGDKLTLSYGSGSSEVKLLVKSKNTVGKGKSYESEKITFSNIDNPNGVKYYAYKRGSDYVGFAIGDMAISNVKISKFADGGVMAKGGDISEVAEAIFYPNNKKGRISTSFGSKTLQGLNAMVENDNYTPEEIANSIFSYNEKKGIISTSFGDKKFGGLLAMISHAREGKLKFYNLGQYADGGVMAKGGVLSRQSIKMLDMGYSITIFTDSRDYVVNIEKVNGKIEFIVAKKHGKKIKSFDTQSEAFDYLSKKVGRKVNPDFGED